MKINSLTKSYDNINYFKNTKSILDLVFFLLLIHFIYNKLIKI